MDFLKIDVYTKSQAVDVLVMRLSELGINGFEIHDSADFDEFLENKDANWDYVDDELMGLKTVPTHITMYLQDNAQGLETLAELKGAVNELFSEQPDFYGEPDMHIGNVREEDWANNWKQYYKPFNVGEKLIIKPSWEDIPDTHERKVLEIDPASSFGTGQHHTTKMVMELLEGIVTGGEKMLDLGCGSGILSIAGLLLGVKEAVMADIFENAVRTAAENAQKNGFGADMVKAYRGNVIDDAELREKIGTGYNIITANIVADVIIAMSGIFGSFLAENGTLVVSGIIDERLDEVMAALNENGFTAVKKSNAEGWNAIVLKRNGETK
ncbi:MAG: 50S ribosomal protein L11 methyltransferase [Ruminiclostridium sp.]|nr:50S ribosomal protein L11 methyltransferase [Ruminiclostridium sp.]